MATRRPKRLLRLALLIGVAVAAGVGWRQLGQKDMSTKLDDVDRVLSAYHQLEKFNGAVLVAQDGEILFRKGYGLRNANLGVAHSADSIFRIYSVTKPFTSTMIFKLIEEKKLSLDDRLSTFFPQLPHADSITIEHLLTHTSGLYEFTQETDFENSEASLLGLLKDKELSFPAGQGWQYCNTGYCLLGHIIAQVCGQSYEEAIVEHIFEPLGMKDSGFGFDALECAEKSIGYQAFTGDWKLAAELGDEPFAAGAIHSTVTDLFRFHEALRTGKLLSDHHRAKAWSGCDQNRGYGCGWEIGSRWFRRKVVSHSGGAPGFRSSFSQIPGQGLCVVLLSNRASDDAPFLTSCIYDVLDGKDVDIPVEIPKSVDDLEQYVGFFHLEGTQPMAIRTCLVGERLAVEVDGQPISVLIAKDDGSFSQPEARATIQFSRDEQGDVSQLIVRRGFSKRTAHRVDENWGLVGSAAPGGWDGPDLPFEPLQGEKKKWILRETSLAQGEIKFRLNNRWDFNFGATNDGVLQRNGGNIPVPEAGSYDVLLDATDHPHFRFELRRTTSVPAVGDSGY